MNSLKTIKSKINELYKFWSITAPLDVSPLNYYESELKEIVNFLELLITKQRNKISDTNFNTNHTNNTNLNNTNNTNLNNTNLNTNHTNIFICNMYENLKIKENLRKEFENKNKIKIIKNKIKIIGDDINTDGIEDINELKNIYNNLIKKKEEEKIEKFRLIKEIIKLNGDNTNKIDHKLIDHKLIDHKLIDYIEILLNLNLKELKIIHSNIL